MMKQLSPFLVLLGSPEPHGMVFQPFPFHQQQVGSRVFHAARESEAVKSAHGRNDRGCLTEGHLELGVHAWPDREQCVFSDHPTIMAYPSALAPDIGTEFTKKRRSWRADRQQDTGGTDNWPMAINGTGLAVCPELGDEELNELFAASWPDHEMRPSAPVFAQSLLWVGARVDGRLVGFVNVAGDGGVHAFILDTTVHPQARRNGLGVELVKAAALEARERGARWLHVDYESHLAGFYAQCGFHPTAAGLMAI